MRRIQLAATQCGHKLFRNNVGMGWTGQRLQLKPGQPYHVSHGDVVLRMARPLHSGLAKGSSDLIGLFTLKITPEMVGSSVAVFTSPEIKVPGKSATPEQGRWIKMVNGHGGFAGVFHSVDEYIRGANEWRPVR